MVPSDGVITSFGAAAGVTPALKLKVVRRAGGDNFMTVGDNQLETPVPGTLNTWPTRITVKAGDLPAQFDMVGIGPRARQQVGEEPQGGHDHGHRDQPDKCRADTEADQVLDREAGGLRQAEAQGEGRLHAGRRTARIERQEEEAKELAVCEATCPRLPTP